jgi:prepilin peptidase CpaA
MALGCLLWLLFVTVYDFRQRRVPNWLVLAGATVALAALALGAQPLESMDSALLALAPASASSCFSMLSASWEQAT